MVSNLFLFGFIYLVLKIYIKNKHTLKNFSLIGLTMGLSLSSFYYHFFLESLVLILFLILKYKSSVFKNIVLQLKYYIYLVFTFIITSSPFLINLYFHEEDFNNRLCVYDLNFEYKQTLLNFYLKQYAEIGFILIFLTIIFFTILLNFKDNKK